MKLFNEFYFLEQLPLIMKGKLPKEIMEEINIFVEDAKKVKNHPLSFLKNHVNIGKNNFQVSVNKSLFENSFTFAYLNHLGEYYFSKLYNINISSLYRKIIIRENVGHFDHYDFWINFSTIGDTNPKHNHTGNISSVIYVTPTEIPTIFYKDNFKFTYYGKPGEILLFPSNLEHSVDENKNEPERITISFNLNFMSN